MVEILRKKTKIRKIGLTTSIITIIFFIVSSVCFLISISPSKDDVESYNYPSEFFCENVENYIDYQTDGKCAAYASAYLLRHFGEKTNGEELFSEMKRSFGFVSTNSITNVFKQHGYQSKAYHGSVDTLKQRLIEGNPIIVFIRIPKDTHYAVVVGYDKQYIYLVDSIKEFANASDTRYNRVLYTSTFENAWKTKTLLPNNIYIVVKSIN